MTLNREQKAAEVDDLNGRFAKAQIAIATDYRGLTVADFQELRIELRKNNAEIRVAKNTLLKRAVQDTSFEPLQEHFIGTTAVTVSYDDPVPPAKVLVAFSKNHEEIVIRGGVLDGKPLTADDLLALSKLPSREVMLAKLLSVMHAVPTGFVRVLNAVPQSMVFALQAIKDKKEQEN
jgi:large subunit ribosomal protein L10